MCLAGMGHYGNAYRASRRMESLEALLFIRGLCLKFSLEGARDLGSDPPVIIPQSKGRMLERSDGKQMNECSGPRDSWEGES